MMGLVLQMLCCGQTIWIKRSLLAQWFKSEEILKFIQDLILQGAYKINLVGDFGLLTSVIQRKREVRITHISVVKDANEELLHWLQVCDAVERIYDTIFLPQCV
jgi:methylthioribose-1-phosphate isomerase